MKDPSLVIVGTSDPFNKSNMNEKALTFHTQLHDWSEAQKLSDHAQDHTRLLTNARQKEVFLPIRKLTHIEYWTREVNKYYKPSRNCRVKSGSYMKIDVSKYNMKVSNNKPTRSKSAMVPPKSAKSKSCRPASTLTARKRRFFGTDVNTVNNQIIESQLHYSAQRKDIYSANASVTKKKNNTKESTKGADTIQSGCTENGVPDVWESETMSTLGSTTGSKRSYNEPHDHVDHANIAHKGTSEPVITLRSWSNKMLNVISIDDCKLACRYRPQPIKEIRSPGIDYEKIDKQENCSRKQPTRKSATTKHMNTPTSDKVEIESLNDGDDEAEADINVRVNGLHLGKTSSHNNTIAESTEDLNKEYEQNEDERLEDHDDPDYGVANEHFEPDNSSSPVPECTPRTEIITNGEQEFNPTTNLTTIEQRPKTGNKYRSAVISCDTSKSSYGRITSLYSQSDSINSKPRKKKVTRATRINHAIDDMVKARKVMNPIDRDFDSRTAQYGRTVLGKQEGSEHFQKLHTNLRKRIDAFIDNKGAMKTQQYFQNIHKNGNS